MSRLGEVSSGFLAGAGRPQEPSRPRFLLRGTQGIHSVRLSVDSKGLSISSGLPTWIVSLEASQGVSEISCETDWIETMSKVKREFPKYGRLVVKDGDTVAVFAKTGITAFDPQDEFPYVVQVYRVVAERSNPELTLVPLGLTTRVSAFDAKKLETVDVRL